MLFRSFALLALLFLAGCPSNDPPTGAACALTSDCGGAQCWRGRCIGRCTSDAECGAGSVCSFGVCGGRECTAPTDCGAGQRCTSAGICAGGGDAGGGAGRDAPCTAGSQCESGLCLPAALGGKCAAGCTDSTSCGNAAQLCAPIRLSRGGSGAADAVVSACVDADMVGASVGSVCVSDADCASRSCREQQCVISCDDDTDCVLGQTCRAVGYDAGSARMCWYPDAMGVEVRSFEFPGISVATGTESAPVTFALPPNVIGVAINGIQPQTSNLPLSIAGVYSPANETLLRIDQIAAGVDQPLRYNPSGKERHVGLLIPNSTTDRVGVRGGRYAVTFLAVPRSTGDMQTTSVGGYGFVKVSNTPVSSGTLALNVHLVGVGLTAATAPSDPRVASMVGEIGRILGGANITLGTVGYFDVAEPAASMFSVIDSITGVDSEMLQLFANGQRSASGVNLFLVRQINSSDGFMVVGASGGIPGTFLPGSYNNGVVVAFDPAIVGPEPMGSRKAAQIATHEACHTLGLFHNVEALPPCPAGTPLSTTCAPFNGDDPIADTSPADGNNLMYYQLGGPDMTLYNTSLTAGQAYVLTRSPLVR